MPSWRTSPLEMKKLIPWPWKGSSALPDIYFLNCIAGSSAGMISNVPLKPHFLTKHAFHLLPRLQVCIHHLLYKKNLTLSSGYGTVWEPYEER